MVSTETITEGTEENSVGTDEEPPHELCDLWVQLVTRWRTIPRALAACDLSHLQHFGESDLAALWRQAFGPTRDVPTRFLASLVSTCEALPRSQLLQAFAFCAPRVTFREWSNAVLLAYERLADLALTLRSGGKPQLAGIATGGCVRRFPRPDQDVVMKELPSPALPLRGVDFAEALSMQEIPSTDALQWLDAVRASGERSKCGLDFDLLSRRIIDQKVPQLRSPPTRPQQGLPLEDIAIRLIHSFGDLTSAFNLLPKASQVNQTQPRSAAANRSLSPEFFGPARLPGASKARATDLGGHVARNAPREAKAEGDVYALTERQWLHALRGSSHCRLPGFAAASGDNS
ncbi:TTN [Symbiodinium sp. CCMP2592]|nr:TTN [Symbiodinium sp. CCMP2592]